LNQQLQMIEQSVVEMQDLELSLVDLEKDESKDILANLGKGIYIPVEIKDKKLIVEVGKKNFVKKTIPETKDLITEQLTKLVAAKSQTLERLESLQKEIQQIMTRIQQSEKNVEVDKKE